MKNTQDTPLFKRQAWQSAAAHGLARLLGGLCLCLCLTATASPATGSWHAVLGDLALRVPGRIKDYPPLQPPPLAQGRQLTKVSWQFGLQPRSAGYQAWICHPQRCFPLHAAHGSSLALAGLAADQPLHVRFRLSAVAAPLRVQALQVRVEYR